MLAPTAALTLFLSLTALVPSASATFIGRTDWRAPSALVKNKAPQSERNSCSGAGSFFTEFGGKAICCSDKTRTPPRDVTCPRGWSMHKEYKICIPPKEVEDCECGEGFGWNGGNKKCKKNENKKCKPNQWYHDRTDSCCDNDWSHNPPKGDCEPGKTCPPGWFWHKQLKKCKPQTPQAPSPGCGDWDDKHQCCGGHQPPKPSKVPNPPPSNDHDCKTCGQHGGGGYGGGHGGNGGNGGHGGWGGHKRDFVGRKQEVILDQPTTDMDKLYCPAGLHACSINTSLGGEWAYECIDFATELESCGGCASLGEGQDCTAIPNAVSVGCEAGVCAVFSCDEGFAVNGTSCVEL